MREEKIASTLESLAAYSPEKHPEVSPLFRRLEYLLYLYTKSLAKWHQNLPLFLIAVSDPGTSRIVPQEPRSIMRYLLSSIVAFVSPIRFDDVETTEWTEKHLLNSLPRLSTGLGEREGSGEFLAPLT